MELITFGVDQLIMETQREGGVCLEMYFSHAHIEGSETVSFWYILVEIFLFTDYLLLNTIDFRIRESRYAVGQ